MPDQVAVIMAGGGGTRLWPASTRSRPKQLIDPFLAGTDGSLLAATLGRIEGLVRPEDVWIVTARDQFEGVRAALPTIPAENFIVEPFGRNTAPCLALAVAHLRARLGRRGDDVIVLALPADHHVRDAAGFRRHLAAACVHARTHRSIVTLGIEADRAETGYGYIERSTDRLAPIDGDDDIAVYPARRFVEKPDEDRAREFVAAGTFLWNAGIFVMPLGRFVDELERHCEAMWTALEVVRGALEIGDAAAIHEATARAYERIESIPVDIAVMEKVNDLRVIPARFGWTDLGSWKAVHSVLPHDGDGTAIISGSHARTVVLDSRASLVWNEDGVVGVIGIEGVAVIVSGARVLVCPLDRAQEVRRMVAALDHDA